MLNHLLPWAALAELVTKDIPVPDPRSTLVVRLVCSPTRAIDLASGGVGSRPMKYY
jgi:hypothetical protein